MKIDQYCQRQCCKLVKLEQFWHAFASRGFVSDSWAFLFLLYLSICHVPYISFVHSVMKCHRKFTFTEKLLLTAVNGEVYRPRYQNRFQAQLHTNVHVPVSDCSITQTIQTARRTEPRR